CLGDMSDIVVVASHPVSAAGANTRRGWWPRVQRQLTRPLPVLGLALLAGAVTATVACPNLMQLHRAVLWSIGVLVSLAGWGRLVGRVALGEDRADVGMRLAWGMAALVVIGGVGCWAGVANRSALMSLVVAGVVFASPWFRGATGAASTVARAPRWPPSATAG